MKTERELFEEWYIEAYKNTDIGVLMDSGQYSSRRKQHSWDAWQASTSREGYELVPIEPNYKQLDALKNSCELFKKAGVSDLEAHGAYKAMIGAIE